LNRGAEARTAYDEALTLLDPGSPERNFVEMKRDDLPEAAVAATPAAPAAATPAPAASPAPEGAKS
jgi:predicted RNA polymerase sigma factor